MASLLATAGALVVCVTCACSGEGPKANKQDDSAGAQAGKSQSSAGTGGDSSGGAPDVAGSSAKGGTSSDSAGTGGSRASGGKGGTAGSGMAGTAGFAAGPPARNPCLDDNSCPPATWINVTPAGVNLKDDLDCGNYGTEGIQADARTPGTFYTEFMCQGVWRTTDYGATWNGPINTGDNGAAVGDCAGGISIGARNSTTPPIIYQACIRGNGSGFWRSSDGGVNWTKYTISVTPDRQDYYPPAVDPYDDKHLLMAGHEMNPLIESTDGGEHWSAVSTDAGMQQNGGTAEVFFLDTGNEATTRTTFLWIGQQSTLYGTWRTTNSGTNWKKVDNNEHPHGISQVFQPDTSGIVYMAGAYSELGWGVLRSEDYGATWTHVGSTGNEAVVFGTPNNVYAMASGASGLAAVVDTGFELSPAPGSGAWTSPAAPVAMTQGAAQGAVTNDGKHYVILTANWGAGVWRYVEP